MPGILEQFAFLNPQNYLPESGTVTGMGEGVIHKVLGLGPEKPPGTAGNQLLEKTLGL